MKEHMFKSALAPYIQGLLDQKRALGFKYDTEEYFLGIPGDLPAHHYNRGKTGRGSKYPYL